MRPPSAMSGQLKSHPAKFFEPPEPDRAPGVKLDDGKGRPFAGLLQYFPRACLAVAEVSEVGANAPGHVWGGWEHVPDGYQRYTEALSRHLIEEAKYGPSARDPQDSLLEAAKVAWNAMCRLELILRDLQPEAPRELVDTPPRA